MKPRFPIIAAVLLLLAAALAWRIKTGVSKPSVGGVGPAADVSLSVEIKKASVRKTGKPAQLIICITAVFSQNGLAPLRLGPPPVTLWSASHTPVPPLCATTELLLQGCHFAHSFIHGNAPPTTARRAPAEIDLAPTPSGPGKRRPIAGGRIHAPLQSLTRPAQGATY